MQHHARSTFVQHTMSRGFTLVEMLVAVAIFAIVMTMSVSALMDMVSATRKAQAIQSVMNNLNVALDGMVRNVRMGTRYHCGNPGDSASSLATVADCTSSGKNSLVLRHMEEIRLHLLTSGHIGLRIIVCIKQKMEELPCFRSQPQKFKLTCLRYL